MELWIRSQDRDKLLKVNELKQTSDSIGNYNIIAYAKDYEYYIGTYKTKERALEVLDEIQNYILLPNTDNSAYVYEMPKE